MFKRLGFLVGVLVALSSVPSFAKGWIFSGGLGLTVSPELFLINPQLEYIHDARLTYGPMVQVGVGSGGSLFTVSGTVRYLLGNHPRFKPAIEGGMGIALASGAFGSSSAGVHIMAGMGFDYRLDNTMSLGTMIRMNLAPPLKTFFLSWPLILFRMAI